MHLACAHPPGPQCAVAAVADVMQWGAKLWCSRAARAAGWLIIAYSPLNGYYGLVSVIYYVLRFGWP
jgi:hypothetical protein